MLNYIMKHQFGFGNFREKLLSQNVKNTSTNTHMFFNFLKIVAKCRKKTNKIEHENGNTLVVALLDKQDDFLSEK